MGSTVIINRTADPLHMKIGNHRHFASLATVGTNDSYTVKVDYNDTYREYCLEAANETCKSVIVNSDECVDNERIIIKEVQGKLQVEREPRVFTSRASTKSVTSKMMEASKKKSKWKFWS